MRAGLVSLVLGASVLIGGHASAEPIAVVVNAKGTDSLTKDDLRQIYLKKRTFWREGVRIVPINRDAGSEIRRRFERFLFERTPQQLGIYWNRQYFRGVLPPATLASDEAVLRFVAGESRAIGYLRSTLADESVRIVLYLRDGQTSDSPPPETARRFEAGRVGAPLQVGCQVAEAGSGWASGPLPGHMGRSPLPVSAWWCRIRQRLTSYASPAQEGRSR